MPEIKRRESLTEWIAYELAETTFVKTPTIRFRLRYLDSLDAADEFMRNGLRRPLAMAGLAMQAVADWDLTENGKPIPVNDETKAKFLRPLLAEILRTPGEEISEAAAEAEAEDDKPESPQLLLAYEIVKDAQNHGLFLKN